MRHKSIINANVKVSKKVKCILPIVGNLTKSLAEIDIINFIKVSPDFLQASSEVTEGRVKIPITKPEHPTAIGIYLIIDSAYKDVQFYEITSAIKGYGGKMVSAVFNSLTKDWHGVVVMDWSDGFWGRMKEKYHNLEIM